MIDIKAVSEFVDQISELEQKYLIPMQDYTKVQKDKHEADPTNKAIEKSYIESHNKTVLLSGLVANGRKVSSWLAGMVHYTEELESAVKDKKIIKDGRLSVLFEEQKTALVENITKLIAYVSKE